MHAIKQPKQKASQQGSANVRQTEYALALSQAGSDVMMSAFTTMYVHAVPAHERSFQKYQLWRVFENVRLS